MQKLPTPENAVENLPPLPQLVHRQPQVTEIFYYYIGRLTHWTSGALLLQRGSGNGKSYCTNAMVRQLELLSSTVQAEYTLHIIEIDLVFVIAPDDFIPTLVTKMDIDDDLWRY